MYGGKIMLHALLKHINEVALGVCICICDILHLYVVFLFALHQSDPTSLREQCCAANWILRPVRPTEGKDAVWWGFSSYHWLCLCEKHRYQRETEGDESQMNGQIEAEQARQREMELCLRQSRSKVHCAGGRGVVVTVIATTKCLFCMSWYCHLFISVSWKQPLTRFMWKGVKKTSTGF